MILKLNVHLMITFFCVVVTGLRWPDYNKVTAKRITGINWPAETGPTLVGLNSVCLINIFRNMLPCSTGQGITMPAAGPGRGQVAFEADPGMRPWGPKGSRSFFGTNGVKKPKKPKKNRSFHENRVFESFLMVLKGFRGARRLLNM